MTNGNSDPYEALGLLRDATAEDIRQAYRQLVKRYHPDLNPGDLALEDRIRAINEAYSILSDEAQRADYDRDGQETISEPAYQPPRPAAPARKPPRQDWFKASRRNSILHRFSGSLFYVALALAAGTLLVKLVMLVFDAYEAGSAGSPSHFFANLIGLLAGFTISLKLACLIASGYMRDRDHERWSAGLSIAAMILLLNPLGISFSVTDALPSLEGFVHSRNADQPSDASETDSLPDVAASLRVANPAPGLSVPDQHLLHNGFALAEEQHVYTATGYKTVYSLDGKAGTQTLSFEESLEVPYAAAAPAPELRYFTVFGSPGYATYHARQDGTIDGHVHWSDGGHDLAIHIAGVPQTEFPEQNLTSLLVAVRRVPLPQTQLQPAATLTAAAAERPQQHPASDPCGPGTVCFDRKTYGHGWFIRRGRGNQHPS